MIERYFDNASTTPVDPLVVEAMAPYWSERPGNAHSIHSWGLDARNAVESAREKVARLMGADDPQEIVFTSGATEANNWILANFERSAISPFEHSSILEPARRRNSEILKNKGYRLEGPTSPCDLLSVMLVNNETGAILEPPTSPVLLHRDVTQAIGKVPFDLADINFASFSAHKIYGPKGVGALWIRGGDFLEPLLLGGGQEHGLRAGTLNVAGIVGFGEACSLCIARLDQDREAAASMRQAVLAEVIQEGPLNSHEGESQSPYILSLTFESIQGETLLLELDRQGFGLSSGAACSSNSEEPSHVLTALGVSEMNLRSAIRVSFGRFNTNEAAQGLGSAICRTVRRLREFGASV